MSAERIINAIIDREGSAFTDYPNDPGGPTKWGITIHALAEHRGHSVAPLDVLNLSRAEAFDIYLNRYYLTPGFGKIASLSQKIADELTDTGVNCGTSVAAQMLQRVLNAFNQQGTHYPDLLADGSIGAKTIAALSSYLTWRGSDGERVMLAALNCLQGERYIELAEKNAKLEDYAYGWIRNRVVEPA